MSKKQFEWFGSMMNIGAMAGSLGAGPVANIFGRKKCLMLTALVYTLGYFLLAMAPHQSFLTYIILTNGYIRLYCFIVY